MEKTPVMKSISHIFFFCLLILTQVPVSGKNAAAKPASKSVDGAWQILEVSGKPIEISDEFPFLNFDILKKSVNGFSGCNYIHGKFKQNSLKSRLSFYPVASTRMMCPRSQTETAILQMISRVSAYRIQNDTDNLPILTLTDPQGNILLRLKKMLPLDGKWKISKVNENHISDTAEGVFIAFNSSQKKVYGNFGCNAYNASFESDPQKPAVIRIGPGLVTMMSCPDMDLEKAMLELLPTVVSFKKFSDRKAILCDASGKTVIELSR